MPDAPEEAQHETSLEELQRQDHELWGKILALQERFSYFFLAASGSAIVFTITRTEGQRPACWMLPALAAVLTWGASFFLSACHLQIKVQAILGDWKSIHVRLGRDAHTRDNPTLKESVLQKLDRDKRVRDKRSALFGRWAFYLFLIGGAFYLVAHIQRLWCGL
jgi:hypothetical protein